MSTGKVGFEENCGTRFLDGVVDDGTPITQLLFHVDLTSVEEHIKTKYFAKSGRKFHFDIGTMIRLVVLKAFRKSSFRKTLYPLTDDVNGHPKMIHCGHQKLIHSHK